MIPNSEAEQSRTSPTLIKKDTPADIIQRGFDERLRLEEVIRRVEAAGFGGKDHKLNGTELGIVAAAFAECRGEAISVVQEHNAQIVDLFKHVTHVQGQVTVGTAAAIGHGLNLVAASAARFLQRPLVPTAEADRPAVPAAGGDSSVGGAWERLNKRGYFVLGTLIVAAVVAVWVTKETASWKSAAEAARTERDSHQKRADELDTRVEVLERHSAGADRLVVELQSQLEVSQANAETWRSRYDELSGKQVIAQDAAEWKSKYEVQNADLAALKEELGTARGKLSGAEGNAETYRKLYEKTLAEKKDSDRRAKTLQEEKDRLVVENAKLKARK